MFHSSFKKNESEELSKLLTEWKFMVKHMDRRFGMVVFRKGLVGSQIVNVMTQIHVLSKQ